MQHDWQKELEDMEINPDIDRIVRIVFVVGLVIVCGFLVIGALLIVRGLM